MRKTFKKLASVALISALALTTAATVVPSDASAGVLCSKDGKKAGKAEFDPAGTYHVYFGLQQTNTWIYRDSWYNPATGLNGTEMKDPLTFDAIMQNGTDGATVLEGATVTDAEITGNGTYTVGVEGLNGCLTADADAVLSLVYMSTDLPSSGTDTFKISDVVVKFDDKTQSVPEELYENLDAQEHGLYQLDVVNTYAKDSGDYANCPSLMAPTDSIKITFTVSGMTNDNPDAVAETPTPAPKADKADSADKDDESGISTPVVVGIVVAVVVIAGVAVVVTKKKK